MKAVAIVRERMGSTSFSGKLLREVNRQSLIEILLHRLSKAKQIDQIVLATSINSENNNVTIDYHPH